MPRGSAVLYGLLCFACLISFASSASSGDAKAPLNGPDPFPLLKEERLGELRLGLTEKEVKAKIPCRLKKGQEEYWAATGDFVQKWEFPDCGITLDMSSKSKGGKKTVSAILVKSPSLLKTKRGIGIGGTEQEVAAAYGDCQDKERERALFCGWLRVWRADFFLREWPGGRHISRGRGRVIFDEHSSGWHRLDHSVTARGKRSRGYPRRSVGTPFITPVSSTLPPYIQ